MNRKTITLSALWTRRLTALLAVAGLNLCLAPGVMAAGDFRVADIELRRTSDETWLATWSFSEPVEAVRVYPPELGFRKRSWVLETEGLQIEETGEGAVIRHVDGPMHGFSIAFSTDSEFEDKTYVPVLPFSDGGAAVYTGHFSADVFDRGQWASVPTRFSLRGREGERTLLPDWASEVNPVYAYVGPQEPLVAGGLNVIADPAMPPWLLEIFEATVPRVTARFSKRLDYPLSRTPLVLIAAGELRQFDGYSVKGAGLDGQFTVMLRGTALLTGSDERRRMFEKMLAHELVHIWQQAMPGGDFNPDQPWLHEGSAEALAVHALHEVGAWSDDELREFHEQQGAVCRDSLGEMALAEAADSGNWDAIYACGYLEFTDGVDDPFGLWRRMVLTASVAGRPYSQTDLEQARDLAPH